ncbi:MAG: hypothetical protein L0H73_01875 [Nitrococcus sp.]|nr:hypothetical protein [Nitrococcus sp.]
MHDRVLVRSRRFASLIAGVLLVLLANLAVASQIEVIELRHRLAEELAPTLSAVAGEDVVVSAAGSRLIVRGSPEAIERMRKLAAELDTATQSLRISVRRVSGAAAGRGGVGADRKGVEVYSSRSAQDSRLLQTVTVRAGQPAFIDTGKSVPITDRRVILSTLGAAYTERRRYQHRPQGFYATARLVDGRAIVDISVADSSGNTGGAVQHRRLVSTVSGELGEWIGIGTVREGAAREGSGIIFSTRNVESDWQQIEIRVDVAE